jgi:polysaccharide deacetylase 2 family uncharacterized protein YibQ
MARGFLSGGIWGTVLSVGGLGALSVLSPGAPDKEMTSTPAAMPVVETAENVEAVPQPVEEPRVVDAPVETTETATAEPAEAAPDPLPVAEPTQPETAVAAITEATETAPEPESQPGRRPTDVTGVAPDSAAPGLNAPSAGNDAAPDTASVAPTAVPETGDAIAALSAPQGQDAPDVGVTASSVAPKPVAAAPTLNAPQSELGLSVSTEPAQPPAPAVPEVQTALVPEPEVETPVPDPEADSTVTEPEAEAAPARPAVRRLVPDTTVPEAPDNTETAALARPAIGRPASSLVDRDGASTSRLPSIADPSAPPDANSAQSSATDTGSPLSRFAASTDTDPSLPRLAIVLIDDGKSPLGPDTLENFPFPVTFALDPGQEGASVRMAAYRALGYEVAALADLPDLAAPSDIEQLLAGAVAAIPEAVALIEAPDSGVQNTRASTEQVTAFAAGSGHGLVFLPNGLNTAEAIARRDNVAAVSVLRDFDGEGQDARTKRRFLDGAAFRARQDGSAVMLGRLTPDTLSALLLWSLQDRASSVAMVPVSAILLDTLQ